MPFDDHGVYTRNYRWQDDAANSIRISPVRVDAETDGIVGAINDVLAGRQAFTGTVRASAGTVAAPGFSFRNDIDTGIYRSASDTLSVTTGGTNRVTITHSSVSINPPLVVSSGTATDLGLSFAGEPTTGFRGAGHDDTSIGSLDLVILNRRKVRFAQTTGIWLAPFSTTDLQTGLNFYRPDNTSTLDGQHSRITGRGGDSARLLVTVGNKTVMDIHKTSPAADGDVKALTDGTWVFRERGSAAVPAIAFQDGYGTSDTGIYSERSSEVGTHALGLTVDGSRRLLVGTAATQVTGDVDVRGDLSVSGTVGGVNHRLIPVHDNYAEYSSRWSIGPLHSAVDTVGAGTLPTTNFVVVRSHPDLTTTRETAGTSFEIEIVLNYGMTIGRVYFYLLRSTTGDGASLTMANSTFVGGAEDAASGVARYVIGTDDAISSSPSCRQRTFRIMDTPSEPVGTRVHYHLCACRSASPVNTVLYINGGSSGSSGFGGTTTIVIRHLRASPT